MVADRLAGVRRPGLPRQRPSARRARRRAACIGNGPIRQPQPQCESQCPSVGAGHLLNDQKPVSRVDVLGAHGGRKASDRGAGPSPCKPDIGHPRPGHCARPPLQLGPALPARRYDLAALTGNAPAASDRRRGGRPAYGNRPDRSRLTNRYTWVAAQIFSAALGQARTPQTSATCTIPGSLRRAAHPDHRRRVQEYLV
jgi:hypothetical protein